MNNPRVKEKTWGRLLLMMRNPYDTQFSYSVLRVRSTRTRLARGGGAFVARLDR